MAVLLPGLGAPPSSVKPLDAALRAAGYHVEVFTYSSLAPNGSVPKFGSELVAFCRGLEHPVILVGHSLGGVISWWAAGELGENVLGVVTLGSPIGGAPLASLAPVGAPRQLRRHGDLLDVLEGRVRPSTHIAIASDQDGIVPVESAVQGADVVEMVHRVMHTALAAHPRSVALAVAAVERLEVAGAS